MTLFSECYSSRARPVLRGALGAVATAHPLATAAGQEMLAQGGNAADAMIAAQALLTILCPDACGLGGDMLALVAEPAGGVFAVTGAGKSPAAMKVASADGANSVTVPGIVGGWQAVSQRWGQLPLVHCLAPAIRLATFGFRMSPALRKAVDAQRERLVAGGAGDWALLRAESGELVRQPQLARLLRKIGEEGEGTFYLGTAALAIERAIQERGGALAASDLAAHRTDISEPIAVRWGEATVHVQPPPTQGVLLAMALKGRGAIGATEGELSDHLCIELTEAAFAHRAVCAAGRSLLDIALPFDRERAARRGGPRAYLHTAGVAVSDMSGLTLSSLVSVFDDFGSGVFVPELGIALNNRAGGFTDGANAPGPGKRPIHTLAPIVVRAGDHSIALATPGADGQVQTLLQILDRIENRGETLDSAILAPRWRSEGGQILIESDHPATQELAARGHMLQRLNPGNMRFGAVVAAGHDGTGPFAVADWRRECWSGVA